MNLDSTLAVTKTCPKDGVPLYVRLVDLKLPARLALDLSHELVLAPFAADHATPPCA